MFHPGEETRLYFSSIPCLCRLPAFLLIALSLHASLLLIPITFTPRAEHYALMCSFSPNQNYFPITFWWSPSRRRNYTAAIVGGELAEWKGLGGE